MIANELISFHIIERESGKNLITWTYPTITDDLKKFLQQTTFISNYICLRKSNNFLYIKTNNQKRYSIVIISKEYDPDKYRNLTQLFAINYEKHENPVDVVRLYLKCFTSGSCNLQENGTVISCNLNNTRTTLKDLIKCYNYEIVLIYVGILLKRRLLFYHQDSDVVQKDLFAAINLVPYRKSTDIVYPMIETAKELKGLPQYIAGTCTKSLQKDATLYDLFVNIEEQIIQISPQAEEVMTTARIHKDLATSLMKLSLSEANDAEIQVEIAKYTEAFLEELKSFTTVTADGTRMVTVSGLKAKKLQRVSELFLFNLALAENIMML